LIRAFLSARTARESQRRTRSDADGVRDYASGGDRGPRLDAQPNIPLELLTGDLATAEIDANSALRIFPDYHCALAALAQVRMAQGNNDEAVSLLRKRYQAAPHTENLYELGEAQELAGHHEDAQASFRKFESQSRAESLLPDNSNRELISYYIDAPAMLPRRSKSPAAKWRRVTMSSLSIRTPGR